VVRIDDSYGRELGVNSQVVYPVVVAAGMVELVGTLIGMVLRTGAPGSFRRPLKALRKGPEFMVTPIWVHAADDSVVELEVHGHLNRSALVRGDRIRTVAIRPRAAGFPAVTGTIENLTTGRMLRPRRPTMWTHLGLPLAFQAALGIVLIGGSLLCLFGGRR
jgi:hypothetical protein